MKLIQLAKIFKLQDLDLSAFSKDDAIKLEKQIKLERKLNPDLNQNDVDDLLKIIHEFPREFAILLNDKRLLKLLEGKKVEEEQEFISTYQNGLDELKNVFVQYFEEAYLDAFKSFIRAKDFKSATQLFYYSFLISENLKLEIQELLINQLNVAKTIISSKPKGFFNELNHLVEEDFYLLLKAANSIEIKDAFKEFYNVVVDFFNDKFAHHFNAHKVLIKSANYVSDDEDLDELILRNFLLLSKNDRNQHSNEGRSPSFNRNERRYHESESGNGAQTIKVLFSIILVLIFIARIINSASNSRSSYNKYEYLPKQYENVYPEYKAPTYVSEVTYNIENESKLLAYLNAGLNNDIEDYTPVSIKNGENPFAFSEQNYSELNYSDTNSVYIHNMTKYDLIVIKFNKGPDMSSEYKDAYFIKSQQTLNINLYSSLVSDEVVHLYFGNNLATYNLPSEVNSYFENEELIEGPRFLDLPGKTDNISKINFRFKNQVIVAESADIIKIHSNFMTYYYDSNPTAKKVDKVNLKKEFD